MNAAAARLSVRRVAGRRTIPSNSLDESKKKKRAEARFERPHGGEPAASRSKCEAAQGSLEVIYTKAAVFVGRAAARVVGADGAARGRARAALNMETHDSIGRCFARRVAT